MLVLPVSLRELGDRAFMRCAALGGLDLSNCRLTEIGVEVFKESLSSLSTSVDKLEVPSGVTFIAASAFEDTGNSVLCSLSGCSPNYDLLPPSLRYVLLLILSNILNRPYDISSCLRCCLYP